MRRYEVMVIHRPELQEAEIQAKVKEIETLVETRGATIVETDLWGKRRFAYEIDHINEGHYAVVTFDTEAHEPVDLLDRALGLSDAVVRHKVMRLADQ